MGCFSFICKESEKPLLSTSFDGSPCYLFLLKDGKVLEMMYGNYDSYGRVFDSEGDSFQWNMDWHDVCDLMFNDNPGDGIAVVHANYYEEGNYPTTQSENDPNQGWGDDMELMGDTSDGEFKKVSEPYHVLFYPINRQECY